MKKARDHLDAAAGDQPEARSAARFDTLSAPVLENLREDWRDLSANAAEPNPFLEPAFVLPALSIFRAVNKSGVLTVWRGSLLIGLTLMRRRVGYGALPLSFVVTHNHLHQFLGTPLVRRGCENEFARALCDWLDSGPRWAQFMALTRQHVDGSVLAAIQQACVSQGRVFHEFERHQRPMINRGGQSDDCLADVLSVKSRKRLRTKINGLGANGDVTYEELTPESRLDGWLDEFLEFEHRGWKGANGTSIRSSPAEVAFFKTAMQGFFNDGRLRIARLKAGERAIAYSIDISADRALFAFKAAYDPAFKKYSPGVLLDYYGLSSFHNNAAFDCIDSCAAGDHPVLSGMWRDRREICGVLVGRRGAFSRLGLRSAIAIQSAGRQLKRLRRRNAGAEGERS